MSKITAQIGESRAALINNEIAAILAIEFAQQIILGNLFLPTGVAADYINAVDSADIPFVGVMYSKTNSNAEFVSQSQVLSQYIIECKGKTYYNSRRISEVVRAILMNSEYRTLGLPATFGISGTVVTSRDMSIFENRKTSQNDTTAYVVYEVRHYETTEKVTGIPLVQNSVSAQRGDKYLFYNTDLT